jgi:hypothetical protein
MSPTSSKGAGVTRHVRSRSQFSRVGGRVARDMGMYM